MERGLKRIGDMYNMSVAKVKEFFKNRDDLLPLMNELLNEKILAFLRKEASLVEAVKEKEKVEDKRRFRKLIGRVANVGKGIILSITGGEPCRICLDRY